MEHRVSTLPLTEVLDAVHETVIQGIEKDISRWKRKSNKAQSLKDTLHCNAQVRHLEEMRSHMRKGLFDLQDQVALLPGPFHSMEEAVDAVLKLVLLHQQGYSGAGGDRPTAPAAAAGHP